MGRPTTGPHRTFSSLAARFATSLRRARFRAGARVQMLLALLLTALLAFGTVYPLSARASSGYTNDEGVDTCDYPTSGDLNALWSGTPFFDYGWYLGGVNAKDYALCAPWTSSTLSTARSLCWGFTPLWDDLQAPKGCGPVYGDPPTRHDFGALAQMSITTTTAYNQGVASAHAALSAMTSAGFASYETVWLDVEGYDRTQQSCINAVNNYVSGWSATATIDAGVYGSASGSGVADWARISHPPFAVWISDPNVQINKELITSVPGGLSFMAPKDSLA